MRMFKKAISFLLTLILALSVAQVAVVSSDAANYDNGYTGAMAGDGKIYAEGLDFSKWQKDNLDFNDVKNAGYSFVILKCGSTMGKDPCFEEFYEQAKAAGLDVGAYYYSYATTVEEAQIDANNCLAWISGKLFEYPIYFDYEDKSQVSLSGTLSSQICYKFLNAIMDAGYLPGLYSMSAWLEKSWVTTSGLRNDFEGWVARYLNSGTHETLDATYSTQYGMFQYTADKYVNGRGPYDANVCYKDYPTIVKTYGFNGYSSGTSPQGNFDSATGSVGSVAISGWAFDQDETTKALELYVNIGGPILTPNTESFIIKADKLRPDVNSLYGCGDNHGFDEIIGTSLSGEQPVYVYAYDNNGNCENTLLGYKTVYITPDTENPKLGEVSVVSSDSNGYTLICSVSDNGYLSHVYFPTYIDEGENAIWYEGTVENGIATCTIPISDFDNYNGRYYTDVYAYDSAGNSIGVGNFHTDFNLPTGSLDEVTETNGMLHLRGWAFDKDAMDESLTLQVCIGGTPGTQGIEFGEIVADTLREDVDAIHGCGTNHGFDSYIQTSLKGTQDVYVYAINKGNGGNILLGSKTVTISDDTVPPTVDNVNIVSSTADSFTVSCDVSDDRKVHQVNMAVWGEASDDPIWYDMKLENGIATATVPISDFANKEGKYIIHIYAYDSYNNSVGYPYETTFNNPVGSFDLAENKGGAVYLRGWAFDSDALDEALELHVFAGAPSGSQDAEFHLIKADTLREDIDAIYASGSNHGFDSIITTDLRGEQTVYVYALNKGNGDSVFLGSKTVTITEPLCKDVDLDGKITVLDATLVQMHLAQLRELTGVALKNSDATKDGIVSITDATTIQMYLAGIIEEL